MGAGKEEEEMEAGEEFGDGEPEEEKAAPVVKRKEMPRQAQDGAKGKRPRKHSGDDEDAEIDDSEERRAAVAELPEDMKLEKIVALPTWR